jgi:hypothetical protein
MREACAQRGRDASISRRAPGFSRVKNSQTRGSPSSVLSYDDEGPGVLRHSLFLLNRSLLAWASRTARGPGRPAGGSAQAAAGRGVPVGSLLVTIPEETPPHGVEVETTVTPSGEVRVTVRHRPQPTPADVATPEAAPSSSQNVVDRRQPTAAWQPPAPTTPPPPRALTPDEAREAATHARTHWQRVVGRVPPKLGPLFTQLVNEFGLLRFFEAMAVCLAKFPNASPDAQVGHLLRLFRDWRRMEAGPGSASDGEGNSYDD